MTSVYAEVIGDPVHHSLSPVIHGYWLEVLGRTEAEYRASHVPPSRLAGHLHIRRADPGWRGANLTLPHKVAALALVDRISDAARRIGAINMIWPSPDGLCGDNSDVAGFLAPLRIHDSPEPWQGTRVAIVGAGGAARAVVAGLAEIGITRATAIVRDPVRAAPFIADSPFDMDVQPLGAPVPAVDLLVNASPLGMTGQPPLALDLDSLPGHALVYDLVYAPHPTPLVENARLRGLKAIDGLAMLIAQARIGFERFFGWAPPEGAVFEAELARRLGL